MAKKKVKKPAPAARAAPAAAARRVRERLNPKPGQLIVRMYRQGLGDCFLLAAGSASGGPRYVLIDCGVHMRRTDGPERLGQVMQHLAAATGNHLHVVVATHEHADHLSGFVQKGSPFLAGKVAIDELWVAWTEKLGDAQADRLRKKFGSARQVIEKALEQTLQKSRAGPQLAELGRAISGNTDFERPADGSVDDQEVLDRLESLARSPEQQAVWKTLIRRLNPQPTLELGARAKRTRPSSNELALALLALTAKQVTYCEPERRFPLTLSGVPDLRAFVLGPPREEDLLEQDRPTRIRGATDEHGEPLHKEVYLSRHAATRALQLSPVLGTARELGEGKDLPDDLRYPFKSAHRRRFREREGQFEWEEPSAVPERTRSIVEQNYLGLPPPAAEEEETQPREAAVDPSWRRIDGDWLEAFEQLALDLDGDTNNTSLVLAFEFGKPGSGQVMLFPADAQVGNWLSWRDQSYQVGETKFSADDLLRRTALYKVGHHGSHNSTVKRDPRETTDAHELGIPFGLELMDAIIAMIPVDRAAADKRMPRPWKMPHLPLYHRLREKAQRRVLRSDLSLLPLDEREHDADLTPGSTKWSRVPGLRNVRWRRSREQFTAGTPGPLYYDVLFELADE